MTCTNGRKSPRIPPHVPPCHDFHIRRGDSAAVAVRFRTVTQEGATQLLDLSGSDMTLHIDWPGGGLVRRSRDGGLHVEGLQGTVEWRAEPVETARLPEGRIATYRFIRDVEAGERRTLLAGFMIGVGAAAEGRMNDV